MKSRYILFLIVLIFALMMAATCRVGPIGAQGIETPAPEDTTPVPCEYLSIWTINGVSVNPGTIFEAWTDMGGYAKFEDVERSSGFVSEAVTVPGTKVVKTKTTPGPTGKTSFDWDENGGVECTTPTVEPSFTPTSTSTTEPSPSPSPTLTATASPSPSPTASASPIPGETPTDEPTRTPPSPTEEPTRTPPPTEQPTDEPSPSPTPTGVPASIEAPRTGGSERTDLALATIFVALVVIGSTLLFTWRRKK